MVRRFSGVGMTSVFGKAGSINIDYVAPDGTLALAID